MKSFFKIFFASLLALIAFCFLAIFVLAGALSAFSKKTKDDLGHQAVLVIDLSEPFLEIGTDNPLSGLGSEEYDLPSLHDVLRLIRHASTDTAVKGIYLKCGANGNGLGNSEEIREALRQFKKSGKFVYAFADVISQSGYVVANVADKIYCHPKGGVDWKGFVITYFFVKGTLEKLGIEPQIFYAGKFKSATEPFRETHMTEPNRVQSSMILTDLYNHLLKQTAEMRGVDTGTLHRYATEHAIRTAADALRYRLIDGLTYEDEFNGKIRERLGLGERDKINFVSIRKYAQLADFKRKGKDKIAVIYAQGDIIDGKGDQQNIGSETYQQLIRKVRMDKSILAIVFRINSGGGSALASESIWRELSLARKEKPVILSFGNVAASGGYYLSCNADSIFASPTTITGSIGVFSILPNMKPFFNEKLGITFDAVKTSPDADMLSITKPLNDQQRQWLQSDVDTIYHTFISRVADGRKKNLSYIDSIGQGRIWSGQAAVKIGLTDRIGGLNEAISCAARMAKTKDYKLREYPEPKNLLEQLFNDFGNSVKAKVLTEELGRNGTFYYKTFQQVNQYLGTPQARLPFQLMIE